MVARNPMFSGRWTVKKFNATVINDIWPEVAFFSLVATSAEQRYLLVDFLIIFHFIVVSLVSEKTKHKLSISTALLTVLGTVLGLVISFRTSSAYERQVIFRFRSSGLAKRFIRYQDGRKMWTNITTASRNLGQLVCNSLCVYPSPL